MRQKRMAILSLMLITMMFVTTACGKKEELSTTEEGVTETVTENSEIDTTKEEIKDTEAPIIELTDDASIEQYIEESIQEMSLEQKLAQMMILTNGLDMTKENLEKYQPGGVIFFGVDFDGKTIEEVRNRIDMMQSYVKQPLFIGVDEEGGEVTRVKGLNEPNIPKFRGARELYGAGIEEVKKETEVKVALLKELGINLNFNPVADTVANKESYMYSRSASGNPSEVAEYVKEVVTLMNEENVGTCIKHFPGYGNNVNTHETFARDNRALSIYQQEDFLPFQAGIDAGSDIVMVSHIIMEAVDTELPASLSPEVHKIIRDDMNFKGIILTDDLNMKAITNDMSMKEATAQAFRAGNDMIFSADFMASLEGAKESVASGDVTVEQINESVRNILRTKIKRGLLPKVNE